MHVTTINGKKSHKFEREQEGIYGGWKGGKRREKCCNYIIVTPKFLKLKNVFHILYDSLSKT